MSVSSNALITQNEEGYKYKVEPETIPLVAGLLMTGLSFAGGGVIRLLGTGIGTYVAYKGLKSSVEEKPVVAEDVELVRTVSLNATQEQVWHYIKDFTQLPNLVPGLGNIYSLGDRSHSAEITLPLGFKTIQEAELISHDDSGLHLKLSYNGKPYGEMSLGVLDGQRGTVIKLYLKYFPPFSPKLHTVLKPLITNEIDGYLFRLKQLVETGEIARAH